MVDPRDVLVVLGTKEVFTRPWCIMEMWEAATHSVPLVILPVMGKGFDLEHVTQLLSDLGLGQGVERSGRPEDAESDTYTSISRRTRSRCSTIWALI